MDISVIIPTYNGERTIKRAIQSVIRQYGNYDIEILICDDCSTDNTLEIVKRYYVRILINEKHTGGPNAGRNMGISAAKGKYIAFLDQDDEWLPHKTETQMEEIENGYEFVYSKSIKRLE